MAVDKKITDLVETQSLLANDRFVVVDSAIGETKQLTMESLPLNLGNTNIKGIINVHANGILFNTNATFQTTFRSGTQTESVIFELPSGANSTVVMTDHTQTLTNKTISTSTINNDLTGNVTGDLTGVASSATTLTGLTANVTELNTLDGITSTYAELNVLDGITATVSDLNLTSGLGTQLALVTGVTPGTVIASKAVTVNSTLGATFSSGTLNLADVVVAGNLTVSGTQSNLNTDIVEIYDNVVKLNADEAGTPSENGGLEIERGTSDNVQLRWNETSDIWEYTVDGSNYQEIVAVTKSQTLTNKILTNPQINDTTLITANSSEINILDGVTTTSSELNILDGVNANSTHLNLINGLTANSTELNTLDGITSTVAELNILDGVTSSAAELNILTGVTSTPAELNIVDGVTANSTHINLIDGLTANSTELNILDGTSASALDVNAITHFQETIWAGSTTLLNINGAASFDITGHDSGSGQLKLGGVAVTANSLELNLLDGLTANSTELNILDTATVSTGELNLLVGLTANSTELNKMDGVTSTNAHFNLIDGLTANSTELNVLDGVSVTTAEVNRLSGIGSSAVGISDSQSLTSKTINADNNTISEIEVDNFKTAAIDTNIGAGVSGSDNTLASALAIKTYIDAEAAASRTYDAFYTGGHANGVSTADKALTANSQLSLATINVVHFNSGYTNYITTNTLHIASTTTANTIFLQGSLSANNPESISHLTTISQDTLTSFVTTVAISSNSVSTFTYGNQTDASRTPGSYNDVTFSTSDSGTGFVSDITVNSTGGAIVSNIDNYGTNFDATDTITIADSQLGSGGGGALVLTVTATVDDFTANLDVGTDGLFKAVVMKYDGGDLVLNVQNPGWNQGTVLGNATFNDSGQTALFQYLGNTTTGKWFSLSLGTGEAGNTAALA
jgi:hypothetical protein